METNKFLVRFVVLIAIVILYGSCKIKENNKSIQTIDLTTGFEKPHKIYLSEITKDYKLIKLETSKECLIQKIKKVFFVPNKIIIWDNVNYWRIGNIHNAIIVFDKSGKYLYKIGAFGKGPGEYRNLISVCIDEQNDFIFVLATGRRILQYNLSGEFIKETQLSIRPKDIKIFDNKLWLFFGPIKVNKNENYTFSVLDYDFNIIKKFKKDISNPLSIMQYSLFKSDNSITYWNNLYHDTIYSINKEFKLTPKYFLEYPDKMPHEYLINVGKANENLFLTEIKRFQETNNHLFITASYKRKLFNLYLNIFNGSPVGLKKNKRWENKYFFYNGFENDIDGGAKFWPFGKIDDNTVYTFIDVIKIKEYFAERKKHIDSGTYKKIIIKFPEKQKELEELLMNSDENDNPIFTIVKLKKF